jgi:hypothetical protein
VTKKSAICDPQGNVAFIFIMKIHPTGIRKQGKDKIEVQDYQTYGIDRGRTNAPA